jgi:hypothetical protein
MSKYIDFDSTYRNRTQYENPNNFIVPVYLNQQINNFYDPVLLSAPFTGSSKPILENTTQFSVDNTHITLDSAEPDIQNFYKNNNLQIDNEFHKIIAYDGITKVATVSTPFSSVPAINTNYTVRKAGAYFKTNVLTIGEGPLISQLNIINRTPSLTNGVYDRTFFTFDNGSNFGKTALIVNYNPNTTNNAWSQLQITQSSSIVSTTIKYGFIFVPTTTGYFKDFTITLTSYESVSPSRILNIGVINGNNINSPAIFSQNVNINNNINPTDITFTFNTNALLYQRQTYILTIIDSTPNGINTGFSYIYGISNTFVYTSINTPTYPKLNIQVIPLTANVAYSQPTLDGVVNVLPVNNYNTYDFNITSNNGFIPDSLINANNAITDTGNNQGYSVAINSDSSLICWGAPLDNGGIGAVYIKDTATNITNKIIPFNNIGNSNFGSSISIYNTTLVIGGFLDNNIGAVWIYTYNGVNWIQYTKLIPISYVNTPNFGKSVKINNNYLIVGGDSDNNNIGKIWIYNYTTSWINIYISNITDNINSSKVGYSVDISSDGNTAIAGGYLDNNGIGATWIFSYFNGNYTSTKIIPTNNSGNSNFGFSVNLNSTYLAIGGPNDTANNGAVWIYNYTTSWVYSTKLFVIDALNGNAGYNVLLNDTANVLSYSDPNYNSGVGIIRNFTRTGNIWSNINSTTVYTNNNNGFAKSIAFNNNNLISGNYNDSFNNLYTSQTNECKYIGVVNNNFFKKFNKNIYSFTVPVGTTNMTFKLWGAGGSSAGGSGGFVEVNLNVNAGEIYYLTVGGGGITNTTPGTGGGGGNTGNANDSAMGGNNIIGSAAIVDNYGGLNYPVAGGGGQYSALHLYSGGKFILIACSAGGGGGSSCLFYVDPFFTPSLMYGTGAGQDNNIIGAVAGSNGIGGAGGGTFGEGNGDNYDPFATTIGANNLYDVGGLGGDGFITFDNSITCGGGGGGYGGGGANYPGGIAGAGAGGGNYIPSVGGNVVSSSGSNGNNGALNGTDFSQNTLPPNSGDIDYINGVGIGGSMYNNGGDGLIVLSANNIGTFYLSNNFGVSFTNPMGYRYLSPNNYNLGITSFTITDADVSKILVKLWGAGGGSVGGSGGYVEAEISVSLGDVFYLTVGGAGLVRNFTPGTTNGGQTGNSDDSAIGGSCIISTAPGAIDDYRVGSGGQYCALHKYVGGKYYLLACAGGGGGGGILDRSGLANIWFGGGANNNGNNGSNSGGGNNGIGGNGSANSGSNYNSNATTTGVNSLNLMGGNGGNGNTSTPAILKLSSSGGGGGYGGGGSTLDIPGAGGGGNYIPSVSGIILYSSGFNGNNGDLVFGNSTDPPNNGDADYISAGGNFGIGGNYFSNGTNGLAVVKYNNNNYFYTTSFSLSGNGQYINCIDVNTQNNLYTSNDYGVTFNQRLINSISFETCTNAYKIVSSYNNQNICIYDNVVGGVFISTDYGTTYIYNGLDNGGIDLNNSSNYGYLIYSTNGGNWIYYSNNLGFGFTPYNISADMANDFTNYGGANSVCVSDNGIFVGASVNTNFYYSYDSGNNGNNWNVFNCGYVIKSISCNYNGNIILINVINNNVVGFYSNDFCNTFNSISGNSLYNYGCYVGSSGRRMFLSSPYLINTTNYGSNFNNLNTNIYSNSNRGIVANNGLLSNTLNTGSISIFLTNFITTAVLKKIQIPLIVYSSDGNRILQVGISDSNNNVLYTNNITLNNNVVLSLKDLNINYSLPDVLNSYKLLLKDVSGNNNGYINIFGILTDSNYTSNTNMYPQVNVYGDTNILINTLLFQQSTNNVKLTTISNSEVGFKIIPSVGGYFSLYSINLTSFSNRILTLNLYNGSGLGGSLLYTTSVNVADYGYNSYNNIYSLALSFPINLIPGNAYTVGLVDNGGGNYINAYGIISSGGFVSYNTSNYANSYVYTSNIQPIFNQPNNNVISVNLSTTTQYGYVFYPSVSGYLYTFSIYLSSFDTSKIRQITSNLIAGDDINGTVISTAVINISNILSATYVNITFDPQTIPILNANTPYIVTLLDTTTTGNTTGFIRIFGINSDTTNYISINTSIYPSMKLIIPQYIIDISPSIPIDSFIGNGSDIISFSISAKDNASTLLYGGGKNVL